MAKRSKKNIEAPTSTSEATHLPHPTVEEWMAIDFEAILANASMPVISDYHECLSRALSEAEDKNEPERARPLGLASMITSMCFASDGGKTVYKPLIVSLDGRRSLIPEDLTDNHLSILAAVCENIDAPDFRARIADVLWLRRPNPQNALIAVNAYLEALPKVEEDFLDHVHRLNRALQIGITLKSKEHNDLLIRIVEYAEGLLDRLEANDPNDSTDRIIQTLYVFKVGNADKHARLLEQRAQDVRDKGNQLRAAQYYLLLQELAKRSRNERLYVASVYAEAECYIFFGDILEKGDATGALIAAHWYETAIQTLRKAKSHFESEIKLLHSRLLVVQERGSYGLACISTTAPVPEELVALVKSIRGKPLEEAWPIFLNPGFAVSQKPLRELVAEDFQKHLLRGLFGTQIMKSDGKTAAKTDGVGIGNAPSEDTIIAEMSRHSVMARQFRVQVIIDPIRRIVMDEHEITPEMVAGLVQLSEFAPSDRKQTFTTGLLYGFHGDFAVAAHLLIPQLENSLRSLLSKQGVTTSGLDKDGIQKDKNLNELLPLPETRSLLGEDIQFDLTSLLISPHGANLRNNLMHGLLPDSAMQDPQFEYFWWLVLRLVTTFAQEPAPENTTAMSPEE